MPRPENCWIQGHDGSKWSLLTVMFSHSLQWVTPCRDNLKNCWVPPQSSNSTQLFSNNHDSLAYGSVSCRNVFNLEKSVFTFYKYSNEMVCTKMFQARHNDIICINRYFSWYSDSGHTDLITYQMANEVKAWHRKFNRPVLVTEYGADSYPGVHTVQ